MGLALRFVYAGGGMKPSGESEDMRMIHSFQGWVPDGYRLRVHGGLG